MSPKGSPCCPGFPDISPRVGHLPFLMAMPRRLALACVAETGLRARREKESRVKGGGVEVGEEDR